MSPHTSSHSLIRRNGNGTLLAGWRLFQQVSYLITPLMNGSVYYAPMCSLQVIKQYLIFMVNTASCNYSSRNDLVLISSKWTEWWNWKKNKKNLMSLFLIIHLQGSDIIMYFLSLSIVIHYLQLLIILHGNHMINRL